MGSCCCCWVHWASGRHIFIMILQRFVNLGGRILRTRPPVQKYNNCSSNNNNNINSLPRKNFLLQSKLSKSPTLLISLYLNHTNIVHFLQNRYFRGTLFHGTRPPVQTTTDATTTTTTPTLNLYLVRLFLSKLFNRNSYSVTFYPTSLYLKWSII